MPSKANTTATKEEANPSPVPKLRFPEFRGAEGWNDEVLEELLAMPATYGIVTAGEFQKEGIPMLRGGDIKEGCVGDGLPFVTAEIHNQYRRTILQTDDVVIALVGYPGEAAVIPQHYVGANISRAVGLLRLKDGRGSRYLAAYLNSPIGRQTVLKPSAGSAQVVVNLKHLNALVIPVPKPAEQQKIAECLSSVDEVIAAQARKLDALKTHRKGLMQQLFPREGETQPRLRFPEFQNAGEWEVKSLGSLASFSSGGTPSKDNPKYWNGSIPWVSASSMYDLVVEKADHYVTPLAIGNGTRIAKKGSILILVRGSMLFKRVPICVAGVDVAFNQDVKALDLDASIDTTFLLYQLTAFQARFPINETGIGAGKIELDHLKGFELFIPKKTAEQHRIATCLSSLDALIAAETQKHAALQRHKRGLMQQLFPTSEE